MIKKLLWLIKHKEEIEELLNKKEDIKKSNEKFSLQGVPDYQLDYINDILGEDKTKGVN